jgi:hypothetical protein
MSIGLTVLRSIRFLALPCIVAALTFRTQAVHAKIDGRNHLWNSFVVGSVDDLADSPIKSFLIDTHFHNPYAKTISDLTADLGPFSPEANKIFWLPTIDMEVTEANWRFLSSFEYVPSQILDIAVVERGGRLFLRMFLHPFSTIDSTFRKMALENGGFRYEHQAATTGSVRSLIAWKARIPKPANSVGKIQFPKDKKDLFWVKVSIKGTNINGSRMNPLKKLVRASMVTKLMGAIPEKIKSKVGFDFAGEWIAAVPDSTDAGFVIRSVLPDYTKAEGAVTPAFTEFSAQRLDVSMKAVSSKDVKKIIKEERFRPIARVVAYLLMEEGMFGEYHTQNYGYRKNNDGRLEDRVVLHDADAFRTSISFRVLNGKDIAPLREVETPFFFMKESMFRIKSAVGPVGARGALGLNSLLYLHLTDRDWSAPAFVAEWCSGKQAFAKWCTPEELVKLLKETLAEEFSPYVKRKVSWEELHFSEGDSGKIALVKLFDERFELLSASSPAVNAAPDERIQELLRQEFERLYKIGSADLLVSGTGSLERAKFLLNISGESTSISAVVPKNGKPKLIGVAVLGTANDGEALEFSRQIFKATGMVIPMMESHDMPYLRDIGGGTNRRRSPEAVLKCSSIL